MRTYAKLIGLTLSPLLVLGACSDGGEEVEVGQAGLPTPEVIESTTTTTEVLTTTTLAPAIVDVPAVPEWGADWSGATLTLGQIKMQEFNTFVLDHSPDNVGPEEAVSVYLQLDPDDTNTQMLSGHQGTPEATQISVIINVSDDDSVRAFRYEFVIERRSRDFAEQAQAEGEAAEAGDTSEVDDELDSNADDAATEEDVEVIEGRDGIPWVLSGRLTVQCQPGRGHQDFSVELCV
jgi:hypothetical protein